MSSSARSRIKNMSKQLKDFHHYKGEGLSRFEKVERKVMEIILSTKVLDDKREESQIFEFMHAGGVMAIGRLLASKRGLNVDIASAAAILHDIAVIQTGEYKDHAKRGAPMVKEILEEVGGFSQNEIQTITQAVLHHSEKEIHSENPYTELVKDADVLESSLYKNAEGFYRLHKPQQIFDEYLKRIKYVRKELGLNPEKVFR